MPLVRPFSLNDVRLAVTLNEETSPYTACL